MNETMWVDIIPILISALSLICTVALLFVIYKQLRNHNIALKNDAQGRLFVQHTEIQAILFNNSNLRRYFFDSDIISTRDKLYSRVRVLAEMYAKHMEHLVLQEHTLDPQDWGLWTGIIEDMYKTSPILQDIFKEKSDWYCQSLNDIIADIKIT